MHPSIAHILACLLAESTMPAADSAHALGWLLVALAALVASVTAIERWVRRAGGRSDQERTIGGQPIKIEHAAIYVTREELDRTRISITDRVARVESDVTAIVAELGRFRTELHATETRINSAGEDRASKIHERINTVLEAVSELRGHVQATDHLGGKN